MTLATDQINLIQEKQEKLRVASEALKSHFCGLDEIIDKIIKSIEVWYVMPELLTRPLTVNLWGMTGVGKTDLVRRLVRQLGFSDRYCEIELTNEGCPAHPYCDSISSILSSSTLPPDAPGILLLDEIQRFRTLSEHEEEITNYKFQDVWTLLGDGRLPQQIDSDYLLKIVFASKIQRKKNKDQLINTSKGKRITRGSGSKMKESEAFVFDDDEEEDGVPNFYTLKRFKEVLRLSEPLEEIATWTPEDKLRVVFKKMEDKSVYDHLDYTKLLIFVSGNIDEAYNFAKKAEEADIDADIFHQQSLQINILDIKAALKKRFRPEQIARFGNTHIIYPSLNRSSYEQIIDRRLAQIVKDVKARWGVHVEVDNSVNKLIYNNGVFPVQGTRPVLSTISNAFENSLPSLLLRALTEKSGYIHVAVVDGVIKGTIRSGVSHSIPFVGELDKLRSDGRHKVDQRIKTSVHEAGHGLVYGLLFKTAPVHIAANAIAATHEGYVGCHNLSGSKEMLLNKITVCLAGAVAEDIVFGSDYRTSGNEQDLVVATETASAMVRSYGMADGIGRIRSEYSDGAEMNLVNIKDTDKEIGEIIKRCNNDAHDLICKNYALFVSIVNAAFTKDVIPPKEVQELFANAGISIDIKDPKDTLMHDYLGRYQRFIKSSKQPSIS